MNRPREWSDSVPDPSLAFLARGAMLSLTFARIVHSAVLAATRR
jgi:hypothetical protein